MFIKPVEGRQVPDPETGRALPETGREVEQTAYWMRRIKDGDVTVEKRPAAERKPR